MLVSIVNMAVLSEWTCESTTKYDVIKFALFWFEHLSMNLNASCPKIFETNKFFFEKK